MVTFSFTPGTVNQKVIDYSKPEGLKLFDQYTQTLENKYDGDSVKFKYFTNQVLTRDKTYGWNDIMDIQVKVKIKHLIKYYGNYMIQDVK